MGEIATFVRSEDPSDFLRNEPGPLGIAAHFLKQPTGDNRAEQWPLVWWCLTVMYPDDLPTFDQWHDLLWDLVHLPTYKTARQRREVTRALADHRLASWTRRQTRVL